MFKILIIKILTLFLVLLFGFQSYSEGQSASVDSKERVIQYHISTLYHAFDKNLLKIHSIANNYFDNMIPLNSVAYNRHENVVEIQSTMNRFLQNASEEKLATRHLFFLTDDLAQVELIHQAIQNHEQSKRIQKKQTERNLLEMNKSFIHVVFLGSQEELNQLIKSKIQKDRIVVYEDQSKTSEVLTMEELQNLSKKARVFNFISKVAEESAQTKELQLETAQCVQSF